MTLPANSGEFGIGLRTTSEQEIRSKAPNESMEVSGRHESALLDLFVRYSKDCLLMRQDDICCSAAFCSFN